MTREDILTLATQAFPEYAEKIAAFSHPSITPTSASDSTMLLSQSDEDYVTIYETRNLSDTTSVVYQEYSSGRSIIFIINCGKANSSSTSYGTYTDYYADLHATCSFSPDAFLINGFRHRCTNANVDSILSTGQLGGTVLAPSFVNNDSALTEDSTGKAYACYLATFTTSIDLGSGQYNGVHNAYITVTVQDGKLTIKGS